MPNTLNLLERALLIAPMPVWTERLRVHRNALRNAKKAGHLTPVLAGNLALELNENPAQWITLAVIEGEKESPAKELLAKRLKNRITSL
jgi:hypothetical protein